MRWISDTAVDNGRRLEPASQGRQKILNEGLSSQTASRLGCDGEQNEGDSCHSNPMAAQGRSLIATAAALVVAACSSGDDESSESAPSADVSEPTAITEPA